MSECGVHYRLVTTSSVSGAMSHSAGSKMQLTVKQQDLFLPFKEFTKSVPKSSVSLSSSVVTWLH